MRNAASRIFREQNAHFPINAIAFCCAIRRPCYLQSYCLCSCLGQFASLCQTSKSCSTKGGKVLYKDVNGCRLFSTEVCRNSSNFDTRQTDSLRKPNLHHPLYFGAYCNCDVSVNDVKFLCHILQLFVGKPMSSVARSKCYLFDVVSKAILVAYPLEHLNLLVYFERHNMPSACQSKPIWCEDHS